MGLQLLLAYKINYLYYNHKPIQMVLMLEIRVKQINFI